MGLPSINIAFTSAAAVTVQHTSRWNVAVIVRDTNEIGGHVLTRKEHIPDTLGEANQTFVKWAFVGHVNSPRTVFLYVISPDAEDLSAALAWLSLQDFDYLAGPPDVSAEEAQLIAGWVEDQRSEYDAKYKAVLPNLAADSEAVINFATENIVVGGSSYTAAQLCSRVAGILAGTPANLSSTYVVLEEVDDITRLSRADANAAIDAGKLILIHDGEKVKIARGVNSLVTTSATKGGIFKKIKVVAVTDLIKSDVRRTVEDSFIGKYPCNYDNKLILVTAIRGYFKELSREGIIESDFTVDIDAAAQANWLESHGTDTSGMSEQELREANTQDHVFLTARIKILDVIEDIDLNINL